MLEQQEFDFLFLEERDECHMAGKHDIQKNSLRSVEERDECQGLSCDGDNRFWVVSEYGTKRQG
uniref:Uncharacterized protein n=1 Tax=Nelumbo nucifera TaxID=4432 RepID=A0A822YMT7_NELNU|nr:TPA_asm: hypothetical protein HUJ06_012781 [Nelumbo nucifera]